MTKRESVDEPTPSDPVANRVEIILASMYPCLFCIRAKWLLECVFAAATIAIGYILVRLIFRRISRRRGERLFVYEERLQIQVKLYDVLWCTLVVVLLNVAYCLVLGHWSLFICKVACIMAVTLVVAKFGTFKSLAEADARPALYDSGIYCEFGFVAWTDVKQVRRSQFHSNSVIVVIKRATGLQGQLNVDLRTAEKRDEFIELIRSRMDQTKETAPMLVKA